MDKYPEQTRKAQAEIDREVGLENLVSIHDKPKYVYLKEIKTLFYSDPKTLL